MGRRWPGPPAGELGELGEQAAGSGECVCVAGDAGRPSAAGHWPVLRLLSRPLCRAEAVAGVQGGPVSALTSHSLWNEAVSSKLIDAPI